ncbi:MAG: PorT family protein [Bacteroidetes bacterium]|nr:PorT family protein [Bacteroidota bacterium]
MNTILIKQFGLLLFLIASTTGSILAQTAETERGTIGFRLMPTISSMKMKSSTGGTVKGEPVIGFGFGGLIGYNFNEHVGIQAEVIYNTLYQRYKDQNVENRVRLKYVSIPLLLSLNTSRYNPVNFNVVAGPQIGISAGSRVYTNGTNTNPTQAIVALRKSDFGLAYGAGLDFGLNDKKTFRLALGFRGVYGLFDITNTKTTATQNTYYLLDNTKVHTYSAYTGISLLF